MHSISAIRAIGECQEFELAVAPKRRRAIGRNSQYQYSDICGNHNESNRIESNSIEVYVLYE